MDQIELLQLILRILCEAGTNPEIRLHNAKLVLRDFLNQGEHNFFQHVITFKHSDLKEQHLSESAVCRLQKRIHYCEEKNYPPERTIEACRVEVEFDLYDLEEDIHKSRCYGQARIFLG